MYTAIIPDAKASTLIPIIRKKVWPDSIVYTDSFQVYDVLDVSEFHHRRVNHSPVFASERGHHINGIETFWNQAKRHLRCFNGGDDQALLQQLTAGYGLEVNRP